MLLFCYHNFLVVYILKNWDEKEYSLPSQNCVSLVTTVAKSIGLNVNSNVNTPHGVVKNITANNDGNTAMKHAAREKRRQHGVSESKGADQYNAATVYSRERYAPHLRPYSRKPNL